MNITLDGFMAGQRSELDWHLDNWGPDMGDSLTRELGKADTILLGRRTYQALAAYWQQQEIDMLFPRDDLAYAIMINACQKVVYSSTLKKAAWNNSLQIRGNIPEAIRELKQPCHGQSKDIIVYGSGKLVKALMEYGLVDEYHLWVHPVILGKGIPLFPDHYEKIPLRFMTSQTFRSGVVLIHYEVENR